MTIKEFYAYTWGKILISIVLVVLSIAYVFVIAGAADKAMGVIDMGVMIFFFWPFLLLLRLETLLVGETAFISVQSLPAIILAGFINAWWFYTLACTIGWIVGRFSK